MSGHRCAKLVSVAAAAMSMLLGCASPAAPHRGLAADVDGSCGGAAWRQPHVLAADVTVRREGSHELRGTLFYNTRRDCLAIQFRDSAARLTSLGYDGRTLWTAGSGDVDFAKSIEILQWASWVSVPYRLTEPAFHVREVQPFVFEGAPYRVAEIQRPADGPVLCALLVDPGTLHPRGAVPLVPTDVKPDAVTPAYGFVYEQFAVCQGVSLPVSWSVWKWNARTGLAPGRPVASVSLENPRFVEPDPAMFSPPSLKLKVPLPSGPSPTRHLHGEEVVRGSL